MSRMNYEKPEMGEIGLDLTGFVCSSYESDECDIACVYWGRCQMKHPGFKCKDKKLSD